ncbi:MAG: YceD family protein [Pseudomonadota bacterium]
MNTRSQETLLYRDLARRGATLTRVLSLDLLPRLKDLSAEGAASTTSSVDVSLSFSESASGAAVVEGRALVRLDLECHRCAEALPHELAAEFHCAIVGSEAQADAFKESGAASDVLVAAGMTVTVADIVEDELLLALPDRLCASEPCEHLPALSYPADTEAAGPEASDHEEEGSDNPFSVMAELKAGLAKPEER